MIGIYKITNLINGKSYIGQSVDIHRRWKQEKGDSHDVNSHSYNYPLMRAFRKYGIENFDFEIIEECELEKLNEREMFWVDYYDTFFNGYNQTFGGDTSLRHPKEKVIGIISDLTNTDMKHRDIAKKWDISMEMVQGINTGRYWRHNTVYPIQRKLVAKRYYCENCGDEITRGSRLCLKCYKILNKNNIDKPDKDTLIKDLYDNKGNFTEVGRKYEVSNSTIRKWCVKYGISNKSSDYKENIVKRKRKTKKIGVIQIDKNTNKEINRFSSIIEATKTLDLKPNCGSHIADVCRGKRKIAYGYKWEFI